ncbi:MAG: class I SAM-dependent methyltransferase [Acidimicrobiales bacterium]
MTATDADDIVEQDQRKYLATNPVVRRLIASWLGQLTDLVDAHVPADQAFLDAGAGAGFSLAGFAADRAVIAADLHLAKVGQIHDRVPQAQLLTADVMRLPVPDDAVGWATSIEVLEHVPAPELLVAELARVCRDGVIVSVPWEPWFRLGNLARGKNVARVGNDPEHIGQFRPATLVRLLGASFAEVTVTRRLPWLLAVATGPRPALR